MKNLLITIVMSCAILFGASAFAIDNPCANDAIHCNYISGLESISPKGKFMKLKIVGEYHSPITAIICVSNEDFNEISNSETTQYQPGQKLIWSFSQCSDEDCTISKNLFKDNIVIKQQGDTLFTDPRVTETKADPNFGVDCIPLAHLFSLKGVK